MLEPLQVVDLIESYLLYVIHMYVSVYFSYDSLLIMWIETWVCTWYDVEKEQKKNTSIRIGKSKSIEK